MKRFVQPVAPMLLLLVFLLGSHASFSQRQQPPAGKEIPQAVLDHIQKNRAKLKLTQEEVTDLKLSSQSVSSHNGIRHVYLKQTHEGIEIHGAVTNVNLTKDGKVINMGNRFQEDVERKVNTTRPDLDAPAAVAAAAKHLNISLKEPLRVVEKGEEESKQVLFTTAGISLEPIPAKLVYQPMEDGSLRLAWEVSIYELDARNWWNIRVDATTGEFLDKDNMVVECLFENNGPEGSFLHENHRHQASPVYEQDTEVVPFAPQAPASSRRVAGIYDVYQMPVESPNHGRRILVTERNSDRIASPDGWHKAGVTSYTITRGNNVYAYEDPDNTGYVGGPQDMYGYSPDGGPRLRFEYPVDFSQEPVAYRDAAITNLFYWNNITHDVWYRYGFDEASGNFQTSNLGRGGQEGDHVMAEAQDSRNIPTTRNNANFATPPDGIRPRMQMYLWTRPDEDRFQVIDPSAIAGTYASSGATFGPPLTPTPLTGKLVLGIDGVSEEGCFEYTNAAEINGNIAVIYRGSCAFVQKAQNAQAAGAIAMVVINNQPGLTTMGGVEDPDNPVLIPSVMITQEAGASIREVLDGGDEVIVSLKDDPGVEVDGDFDNGIIVHEYGHGISIRLTGGPDIVNCLRNAEQAGEGWSDWFGLMMTMDTRDTRETKRGIGTYAIGQPTDGDGIRPAPYSTDFSVNSYTYGATNNTGLSQPHGVGFVFATVLWEMTWDLIDEYGFDQDLYRGTGGNNIAMQLVIDGLKLQPCSPGFVDARDAILLADQLTYGGANQELIWRAFARRGLGFSASQGSSFSRTDQVEAFDLPASFGLPSLQPDPESLSLKAVPNPVGYKTQIEFKMKEGGKYRLEIRDKDGLLMQVLAEGRSRAGESISVDFNRGGLAKGMYVARLVTDKTAKIARIFLE